MISVDRVTKRFGAVTAVKDVSFEIGRDEIVGFVGPNGAGKSTLLRMLATYVRPTSGELRVGGLDVAREPLAVRGKIGYLPGDAPLYWDMRTDRFLVFIGRAQGLDAARIDERLRWVTEACGLGDALGKRIKECSTGYRKRIGLAAALIHDPEILILDEPTHGLDPLQVLAFRDLLKSLSPGRAILISSHILMELAQVAHRLLLIHDGRLLADGPLASLCERHAVPAGDVERLFVELVRAPRTDAVAHG